MLRLLEIRPSIRQGSLRQSRSRSHEVLTRFSLWTSRRDDALIFKYANTCLNNRHVYLILRSRLLNQFWRQKSVNVSLLFLQEQMHFAGCVLMPIYEYWKQIRFSYFVSVIVTMKWYSSGLSNKIGFSARHLSVREIVLLRLSQVGKRENL